MCRELGLKTREEAIREAGREAYDKAVKEGKSNQEARECGLAAEKQLNTATVHTVTVCEAEKEKMKAEDFEDMLS